MKIISITKTKNFHPAFGPEFSITLSSGLSFKMWAEWFWELDSKWDSNPDNRLGLELAPEFVNQYKN